MKEYLNPAFEDGAIERLYPNQPKHPKQKCRLRLQRNGNQPIIILKISSRDKTRYRYSRFTFIEARQKATCGFHT